LRISTAHGFYPETLHRDLANEAGPPRPEGNTIRNLIGVRANGTHRRSRLAVTVSAVSAWSIVAAGAAMAAPAVGGGDPVTYLERSPAVAIGSGLAISGGSSYAGKYLDFAIGSAAATETLSLATDAAPVTTSGVVSIVGSSVYLGSGTTADPIGSVDPARDGTNGQPLRVTFTSAFTNPSFESADIAGWTAMNQQIDLGATTIAGCVPVDTSTYPGYTPNQDNNVPNDLGTLTSTVESEQASDGAFALRLQSSGMTTRAGYDVVHGPAVYTSPFQAAAGDTIYFDWQAYGGDDNFHVFGYIVDEACHQTEVLDMTGPFTSWDTQETVIPSSGTYRFVFVSGTFDASGGLWAGASLYIDNVRVFGAKATDDVAQQVARRLMYANTSKNPPANRTVTVTAESSENGSGTSEIPLTITPVDDAPSLATIAPVTLTNTSADDTFTPVTGTLVATDPENDPITFGVADGVSEPVTIGGVDYTHHKSGTYGTLYVSSVTGTYVLVPTAGAIDPRVTDDVETFTLTASAQGLSDSRPLTVTVDVPDSAPGAPENVRAVPGDGQLTLSWTDSWWSGGSATTGYQLELSTDGGTTWTDAVANTRSTAKSLIVSGLPNGAQVATRVSAINAFGTSTPSAVVSATPQAAPGAPAGPSGTVATGSDTSSGADDAAQATAGPLTGTATGIGSITVSQLGEKPTTPSAPGAGGLDYFQVSTSATSTFTKVELRVTGTTANSLFWFDGTTWRKVAGTTRDTRTGQLVVTLGGSTSPNLTQLSPLLLATGSTPAVRLGGLNRQLTAVAVSKDAYPVKDSAKVAVIAADNTFADALTGGPLAAAKDGPLLLTNPRSLPAAVAAELTRVLPAGATVYILGGTGAVNAKVAEATKALGFRVVRLGGVDRFATAVKIAGALGNPKTVFLASGLDFPDAMSAGPAAITSHGAVLLTQGSRQSAASLAYLKDRSTTRYAIGGQAATADSSATKLVGRDRFATSALVASRFFPKPSRVGVAIGNAFPDALVGAPYLGHRGDPLLLTDRTAALPGAVAGYLTSHSSGIAQVTVFGGTGSFSDALVKSVQRALP
jgi:hypothetical protein